MASQYCTVSVGWSLKGSVGGIPAVPRGPEEAGVFRKPFRNLGRLDAASRAVCEAVACALTGAGLYPSEDKLDMPVFFNWVGGCMSSDLKYYRDFLDFGGTAGRANLFLYTLPTSPLGEASVHFGLTGPLVFISDPGRPLGALLDAVSDTCEIRKGCECGDRDGYFLVGLGEGGETDAEAVLLLLRSGGDPSDEIQFPGLAPETDFYALKSAIHAMAGNPIRKDVR
ncbi:MAG: hypothetical protein JW808_06230 [Victivallales bacterium]|nr:hypothetical protein [Victivallales bacterium]